MPGGRRREELISARKVAGFTQEGLADVLKVDRSTVARWEAGDYLPLPTSGRSSQTCLAVRETSCRP